MEKKKTLSTITDSSTDVAKATDIFGHVWGQRFFLLAGMESVKM